MKKIPFVPYYDGIVIEPFKEESFLKGLDEKKIELGEVIAVGRDVTFVKVGDTLSFRHWGYAETEKIDGVEYKVVKDKSEFIIGKIPKKDGHLKK